MVKCNKYKINCLYNTSFFYFYKKEFNFNRIKNYNFLNFKKNNKIVRKVIFLFLIIFFYNSHVIYTRFFLPDFFNLNLFNLNFILQKSINFFYYLN